MSGGDTEAEQEMDDDDDDELISDVGSTIQMQGTLRLFSMCYFVIPLFPLFLFSCLCFRYLFLGAQLLVTYLCSRTESTLSQRIRIAHVIN